MKLALNLVILLGLALSSLGMHLLGDELSIHLFREFKKSHNKVYLSNEHEDERFETFKKNLHLIQKHNSEYSMGLHTYTLGVNYFADWTTDEFREKMLGTKLNMTMNRSGSSHTFTRLPSFVKTPDSVDWRNEGAVTKVKNQGECGSCWAFSTTGSLEGAHFRLSGELVELSEQQLVDCSGKFHNEGCNGGIMDNAFEYIKANGGIDTEDSYPYHAKQQKCAFKKKYIGATCTGYADIPSGKEDALQEAVATIGPVSIAIDVTEDKFMLYKDGILVDDECSNSPDELNHGVLVVGYGTNSTNSGDSMDYWIVKNSWGTGWGEQGYVRMARNNNNMCGVATMASYPLVKSDL